MESPFEIALSITKYQELGIFPPELAIPNKRTSAPRAIAESRLSTTGTLLLIGRQSLVFCPEFSESITATISFDKYLKAP